jgi:outer membrane protein assembly factor BamB
MRWIPLLLVVLLAAPALAGAPAGNATKGEPAPTPAPGPWPPPAPANNTTAVPAARGTPAGAYEPTVTSPGVREWTGFKGDALRTGATAAHLPLDPVKRWDASGTAGYGIAAEPVVTHGLVVWGALDRKVHAVDANTGFPQWSADLPGRVMGSPAVAEDTLLVATLDGTLTALRLTDGTERWHRTLGDRIGAAPLTANGVVYVVGETGHVAAFEVPSGAPRWNRTLTGVAGGVAPLLIGGRLVVAQLDGTVVALQALTGTTLWTASVGGPVLATPVGVGNRVVVPTLGLVALDAESGRKAWSRPAVMLVRSSPAFGQGMLVYGDPEEPGVIGADAYTGEPRWRAHLTVFVTSPATIARDAAVVASKDGTFTAMQLRNGTILWQRDAGERMSVAPVVFDGRVLVARTDGTVRLFADESTVVAEDGGIPAATGGGNGLLGLLPVFAVLALPYFGVRHLRDRMHRQGQPSRASAALAEQPTANPAARPVDGTARVACPRCACKFGVDPRRDRIVACPACGARAAVRRRAISDGSSDIAA